MICCDPFEDEDAGLGWILGCLVRWGASSVSRYCLFSCMVVCVCRVSDVNSRNGEKEKWLRVNLFE